MGEWNDFGAGERASRFEWANEVCPRCDKPVYQGDWTTRCRCNGSMLRAEIGALRAVVRTLGVYTFTDDSLGPFIAAEKDVGLSVEQEVADAVERARGNGSRKRHADPITNGSTEADHG